MPLEKGKTPGAFHRNVETEVRAVKPVPQAVAIAYSEKERTMGDEEYAPVKGSVSSLAEMNAVNARYHGQLEGETTFPNTGDDDPEMAGDAESTTATCPVCGETCPGKVLPNGDIRINCDRHGKSDVPGSKRK